MIRWLPLVILLNLTAYADDPKPAGGAKLEHKGDEIVVCGQRFHTGTKVLLWSDPGGFDAYRTEPRFAPRDRKVTDEEKAKSGDVWREHYNCAIGASRPKSNSACGVAAGISPCCSASSTSS